MRAIFITLTLIGLTLPASAEKTTIVSTQCKAALDLKLKLVAPFTEAENRAHEAHKKFSTKAEDKVDWWRTSCEQEKASLEEKEALVTTSEEVERVCGKKITAKVLKCDAACWRTWVKSAQEDVKHRCEEYEKVKKAAEGDSKKAATPQQTALNECILKSDLVKGTDNAIAKVVADNRKKGETVTDESRENMRKVIYGVAAQSRLIIEKAEECPAGRTLWRPRNK